MHLLHKQSASPADGFLNSSRHEDLGRSREEKVRPLHQKKKKEPPELFLKRRRFRFALLRQWHDVDEYGSSVASLKKLAALSLDMLSKTAGILCWIRFLSFSILTLSA